MVQAPIFNVNGDDPKACIRVTQLAYDFRQQFKKDVVIDMVCYRRHGHNEADDPSYTQPILYRKIREQPSVAVQYGERLVREKVIEAAEVERMRRAVKDRLRQTVAAQSPRPASNAAPNVAVAAKTAAGRAILERVIQGATAFPEYFHVHPKLKNFIERRKTVVNGAPIDWATGEVLAFGSL